MNEAYSTNMSVFVVLLIVSTLQQISLCYQIHQTEEDPLGSVNLVLIRIFKYSRLYFISPDSLVALQSILLALNLYGIIVTLLVCTCSKFFSRVYPLLFFISQRLLHFFVDIYSLVLIVPNTEAWLTGFFNSHNSLYEPLYQAESPLGLRVIGLISFVIMNFVVLLVNQTKIFFQQRSYKVHQSALNEVLTIFATSFAVAFRLCVDYLGWNKVIVFIAMIILIAFRLIDWYHATKHEGSVIEVHQALIWILIVNVILQAVQLGEVFDSYPLANPYFITIFVITIAFVIILSITVHRKPNYRGIAVLLNHLQRCKEKGEDSVKHILKFSVGLSALIESCLKSPSMKVFVLEFAAQRGIPMNELKNQIATVYTEEFIINIYERVISRTIYAKSGHISSLPPIFFIVQSLSYLFFQAKQYDKACKLGYRYLSSLKRDSFDYIVVQEVVAIIKAGMIYEQDQHQLEEVQFGEVLKFEDREHQLNNNLQDLCKSFVDFYSYMMEPVIDLNILFDKGSRLYKMIESTEATLRSLHAERPNYQEVVDTYINFMSKIKMARFSEYRHLLLKSKELFNKRLAADHSSRMSTVMEGYHGLENCRHIVVVNLDASLGKIVRCSDAMCEMFQVNKREALEGQNVKMLMPSYFAKYHDSALANFAVGNKRVGASQRRVMMMFGQRHDRYIFPIHIFIKYELFAGEYCAVAVFKPPHTETPPIEVLTDSNGVVLGYSKDLDVKLGNKPPHFLENFCLWFFIPRLLKSYFKNITYESQSLGSRDLEWKNTLTYIDEEEKQMEEESEDEELDEKRVYFFSHTKFLENNLQRLLKIVSDSAKLIALKDTEAFTSQQIRDLESNCRNLLSEFKMSDCEVYSLNIKIMNLSYYGNNLNLKRLQIWSMKKIENEHIREKVLRLKSTNYAIKKIQAMADLLEKMRTTKENQHLILHPTSEEMRFIEKRLPVWGSMLPEGDCIEKKEKLQFSSGAELNSSKASDIGSSVPNIPEEEAEFRLNFSGVKTQLIDFGSNIYPEGSQTNEHIYTNGDFFQDSGSLNIIRENPENEGQAPTINQSFGHQKRGSPRQMPLYQTLVSPNSMIMKNNQSSQNLLEDRHFGPGVGNKEDQINNTGLGSTAGINMITFPRTLDSVPELNFNEKFPTKVNIKKTNKAVSFFPRLSFGAPCTEDPRVDLPLDEQKSPISEHSQKISNILDMVTSPKMQSRVDLKLEEEAYLHQSERESKDDLPRRIRISRYIAPIKAEGSSVAGSQASSTYNQRLTNVLLEDRPPKAVIRFRFFGLLSYLIIAIVTVAVSIKQTIIVQQWQDLLGAILLPYMMQFNRVSVYKQASSLVMINENFLFYPSAEAREVDLLRYQQYLPLRAQQYKGNMTEFQLAARTSSILGEVDLEIQYVYEFPDDGGYNLTNFAFYNLLHYHMYAISQNIEKISNSFYSYRFIRENNIPDTQTLLALFDASVLKSFDLGNISKNLVVISLVVSLSVSLAIQCSVIYLYYRIIILKERILKLFLTVGKQTLQYEIQRLSQPIEAIFSQDNPAVFLKKQPHRNSSYSRRVISAWKPLRRHFIGITCVTMLFFAIAAAFFIGTSVATFNNIDSTRDSLTRTMNGAYLPANIGIVAASTTALLAYNLQNSTVLAYVAYIVMDQTGNKTLEFQSDFLKVIEFISQDTAHKLLDAQDRDVVLTIFKEDFCPYLEFYEETRLSRCQTVRDSMSKLGSFSAASSVADYYYSNLFAPFGYYQFDRTIGQYLVNNQMFFEYSEFTDYLIEALYTMALKIGEGIYKQINFAKRVLVLSMVFALVFFALLFLVGWTLFIRKMKKMVHETKILMRLIPKEDANNNLYIKNFLKKRY